MMRFKKYLLFLVLILPILFSSGVRGNPVSLGSYADLFIPLYLGLFFATVVVEYYIIFRFVSYIIDKRSRVFKLVFVVNLFTFPTTQILAIALNEYLLLHTLNIGIYILIELLPITLECLLFLKIYQDLRIPLTNKEIVLSTIAANSITFLIGIGLVIPHFLTLI